MRFTGFFVVGLLLYIHLTEEVSLYKPTQNSTEAMETFNLHVSERGAKFIERITIDKNRNIEYFQVPAHNELSETDMMFDFNMNITVSRVKKDRVCQITPLPEGIQAPDRLSAGLHKLSHSSPSHNIEKTVMQWRMGPQVDKSTLRMEVRDFCGDFKIYKLLPYSMDSISLGPGNARKKRESKLPICKDKVPDDLRKCKPETWLYECKIANSKCVYYVICREVDSKSQLLGSCGDLTTKHFYNSMICCTIKCPQPTPTPRLSLDSM